MRVHHMRHTTASLSVAVEVHPKIVAERLGHCTTNLKPDSDSHVVPSLREQVVRTVELLLSLENKTEKPTADREAH